MIKIMTITKYDDDIADAIFAGATAAKSAAKRQRDLDQRALDAERSITASLRAEIADMLALYDLGVKVQAWRDADSAKRKAKRAAK
jgi:hypothetical protein